LIVNKRLLSVNARS
jgi:hypothetical protein